MPAVSRMIRQALLTQLSGAPGSTLLGGFNGAVDEALGNYGLDPSVIFWEGINWQTDGTSQNFLFGRVSPDFIEQSSAYRYPMVTIDTVKSVSDPRFKFGTFNGPIFAIVEIHLSWEAAEVIPDFASWGDAFEDAVYTTLNANGAMVAPGWTYNRNIEVTRSPIMMGGRNWRQTHTCPCRFEAFV
jgi:hypothetical protein